MRTCAARLAGLSPGQRPEFDEFTIVLRGALVVDSEEGQMTLQAGQGVHPRPGDRVRYSTPGADGAEYISVCVPLSLLTPFTGTDNHSAVVVICLAGPRRRLRRPHRPAWLPAAGNVAVLPAAQNRGIGARLLGLAEDHARSLGLSDWVLIRKPIDSPSDSRQNRAFTPTVAMHKQKAKTGCCWQPSIEHSQ